MKKFLRIFLLFLLFSCSSAEEVQVSNNSSGIPSDWNPSGTYEFVHGGRERIYHYYEPKDMGAQARTSNIPEDLGQVRYVSYY